MALDLTTMRTAVRTRLGNPSTDGFFSDAQLTDLVNEALQVISAEADWPWQEATTTFSTAAGTNTYTPPTDWIQTRALVIDGYDAMEYRTLAEIREYLTTSQDVPTAYTVSGETLLLRPTPDGVYTVRHDYVKSEPALANDTDAPLMPNQWRYSIVAFACHLAHMRQGDTGRAAGALAEYASWKQRMLRQRRRSSGPMRVRIRAGQVF